MTVYFWYFTVQKIKIHIELYAKDFYSTFLHKN